MKKVLTNENLVNNDNKSQQEQTQIINQLKINNMKSSTIKKNEKMNGNQLNLNIIKQKESINGFVIRGENWYGHKLKKKEIQNSLELETLFKGIDRIKLEDSFSDYPPSYHFLIKLNNFDDGDNPNQRILPMDGYDGLFEIFPREDGYKLRHSPTLKNVVKNESRLPSISHCSDLKELVNKIFNDEFSLSVFGLMKIKNVNSSDELNLTHDNVEELTIKHIGDVKSIKEKLLSKLSNNPYNINQKLSDNQIGTTKN